MEKTELLSCKLRLEDHYQLGDILYSCLVESKMDDTSCWSRWRTACGYWSLPYHACLPDRNGIVAGRIDAAGAGLKLMLLELLQTGMLRWEPAMSLRWRGA